MKFSSILTLVVISCTLAAVSAASFLSRAPARNFRSQESDTIQMLGVLASPKLREVSGIALSRLNPDNYWLHNDSGSHAVLYLVSSNGKAIIEYSISDANCIDWEDICSFRSNQDAWLIVGDVGDNRKMREKCTLYLVSEPRLIANQLGDTKQNVSSANAIYFRFEDGPRNCEAIGFSADSKQLLLFEKIAGNEAGDREPGVYQLDLNDCFDATIPTDTLTAKRIATLPIRDVTGMDITADGQRLVVRNYFQAFLFERQAGQSWQDRMKCKLPDPIVLPVELQGEAICFSEDEQALITTSEFVHQPIWRTTLSLPPASNTKSKESAGPTQDEIKKLILPGESFDFEGHAAFILWPEVPKRSSPQPWVFYAPTLPAYPDEHERWMHQQFLDAGVAVAGIDVGEAYGNPEANKVFDKFYAEMTERKGFKQKPCLLGRSRGGLWVSSWAANHPDRFAGLAGIYPVFDWRTYPGVDKAAPAYGLTNAELLAKSNELNPIARADRLASAHLPMFLIHGDQDSVVPLAENSAAMANIYKQSGAEKSLTLQVAQGQGHNMWEGFFKSPDLVEFVIKQSQAN